jgi:serine/threonine protein kinase
MPLDPSEGADPADKSKSGSSDPLPNSALSTNAYELPMSVHRTTAGGLAQQLADGLASGPVIPGYEIVGELGRGGMGVVYKAFHLKSARPVAIKMIRFERQNPGSGG